MDRKGVIPLNATALNEMIRAARQNKKMTQIEAAKALSVSQPYLSDIEQGKKMPTEKLLKRLAAVYSLPLGEMVSVYFDCASAARRRCGHFVALTDML